VLYRLWYREHGTAGLRRNVLNFVGYAPVRSSFFGAVENRHDGGADKWLATMRQLGTRAA
jgi:hypothetical protein